MVDAEGKTIVKGHENAYDPDVPGWYRDKALMPIHRSVCM
jgi:hypothetical protein